MTSTLQLAEYCVSEIAKHGYEALIVCDESTDGEVVLRVPELEVDGELSQSLTYLWVSELLEDSPDCGLFLKCPNTGTPVGIFCFHPDTFAACSDGADVEFWPANAGESFSWSKLATDSTQWCGGWPVEHAYEVGQRIAFLAALLDAEVVELPPKPRLQNH